MKRQFFWLVAASVLCLAGMYFYVQRVLVPYQVSDAAAHGKPRGNLSDLYPRWLGARELLLNGRDPYSAEVTREIQAGYYGRPLDASRPGDPKDQQAFAYPLYVVFYLAPTVELPFNRVQAGFYWLLLVLTASSVLIWLRVLHWRLAAPWLIVAIALTLGNLAALQGLKLQQITLLVAPLLAIAVAILMKDRTISAGILLALATIKPQLVWGLLLWLVIWTTGDWRKRYPWIVSFLVTLTIFCAASEMFVPHWIPRFQQAVREYQSYTGGVPLFDKLIPMPWSRLAEIGAGISMVVSFWKYRKTAPAGPDFALMACLALALTLLIVPTHALYNQVLLLPALLLIARDWRAWWEENAVHRLLLAAVAVLLVWPFVSGTILAGLSFFMPQETVQKAWAIPGWTSLTLPVPVAALMLVVAYRGSSTAPAKALPA